MSRFPLFQASSTSRRVMAAFCRAVRLGNLSSISRSFDFIQDTLQAEDTHAAARQSPNIRKPGLDAQPPDFSFRQSTCPEPGASVGKGRGHAVEKAQPVEERSQRSAIVVGII